MAVGKLGSHDCVHVGSIHAVRDHINHFLSKKPHTHIYIYRDVQESALIHGSIIDSMTDNRLLFWKFTPTNMNMHQITNKTSKILDHVRQATVQAKLLCHEHGVLHSDCSFFCALSRPPKSQ